MGLSVISLCINVIQANIGRVFNEFVAAINREYQKKQLGCTSLMESESTMPGATGVKSIVNSLSIRQRMLFKLMDKQKLAFLEDKFEQQAKMRNQQTQTYRLLTSISVQVDDAEAIKAELEKSGSKAMPIEHRNKSYIYNIDD